VGSAGPVGPAGPPGSSAISGYEQKTATVTNSNNTKTLSVDCAAGKKVVGGGGSTSITNGDVALYESRPLDADTWLVSAAENTTVSGNWTLTVYAVCVS
jgi:hypothetical protein